MQKFDHLYGELEPCLWILPAAKPLQVSVGLQNMYKLPFQTSNISISKVFAAVISLRSNVINGALCLMAQSKK